MTVDSDNANSCGSSCCLTVGELAMKTQADQRSLYNILRSCQALCIAAAAAAMSVGACSGATATPAEPIDMDHELDTLYGCARTTLQEAGYVIAGSNDATRMISTTWRGEGERRHRAFVTVVLHPSYGPGVIARLAQQMRVPLDEAAEYGAGERPDLSDLQQGGDPGWADLPSDEQSVDWQDRFLAEVQSCWRELR